MPLLTAHPGMTHRPQQPMGQKGQAVMQYLNDVASGRIAEQGMRQYGDAVRAGMAGDYGSFGGLLGDAMGGGFAAQGLLGLPGMIGKTVYHGSPHKWDVPDISKVGTGEGAQAYGHGFYSAEAPVVAASYRDALSGHGVGDLEFRALPKSHKGNLTNASDWEELEGIDRIAASDILTKGYDQALAQAQEAAKITQKEPAGFSDDDWLRWITGQEEKTISPSAELVSAIKNLKGRRVSQERPKGHLYKLDIPDEDIPKYLDWDKPLSEQPLVMKALQKLGVNPSKEAKGADVIQGDILKGISDWNGIVQRPEELLRQKGIPGIRYLDGTSRSAGEGTSNYVTFDPSRIKVLERN